MHKPRLQADAPRGVHTHTHTQHALLQRDARSFGSTHYPASPSSLSLGKGGSCQTKRADWEINDAPARAKNPAMLSGSHCFCPLPILLKQNKQQKKNKYKTKGSVVSLVSQ